MGNTFKGGGGVDLDLFVYDANKDDWDVTGNIFNSASSVAAIRMYSGANGCRFANNIGSNGGFSVSMGVGGSVTGNQFINNLISTLSVDAGASTGNLFERNIITGAITHPGATTFASNTWRGNTGAGCAGIFYGATPLVSGTATVTTAAANSARKFGFSRQAPNASTAIGNLALGTVTAQTSFVVNALNDTATVATGDLSSVYWEILE